MGLDPFSLLAHRSRQQPLAPISASFWCDVVPVQGVAYRRILDGFRGARPEERQGSAAPDKTTRLSFGPS
jgi:hypothetical protein